MPNTEAQTRNSKLTNCLFSLWQIYCY